MPNKSQASSSLVRLDKSFADFFAGIGLMRIGLERQAWSFAFANDIDEQKKKMYKGNFLDAEGHYQCRDIHLLSVDDIPTVSLATASFPCNDLSLAGARDGLRGKHSSAFWGFIKTLEKMGSRRPPLVLLENVPGFLTSHKGKDFRDALLALNQLGYVVDAFLLNAMRFVPQSRSRLFVVGLRDDDGSDGAGQTPAILPSEIRPKALADFIHAHSEIHWRIRTLPALPKGGKTLVDVLDDLPPDASEWWSKERVEYLFDQMSLRHRKMADEMARKRKWSYGTVFRRMRNETSMAELRTDGIAGCLRTPRGGSGRQILLKAGYGKYFVRLLTPRECARLMGANGYKISVPLNQALFGFGDAVCVPVIEWIAKHYLNPVVDELNQNCTALQPA